MGKAESETGLPLRMSTEGPKQILTQRIPHRFYLTCKYCNGNHWSDQCLVYPTAQDRKQKIKDSCFLCLREGHIAYNCMSNKTCFYCQRRHHHHRSLCPKKFTENEIAHFGFKETQSIVGDSQTIKMKQKSETELFKDPDKVIKHNLGKTTDKTEPEVTGTKQKL